MYDILMLLLTVVAALTVALIAGVFFIFSVTIMRALSQIPAANAIVAMQTINRVVLRSLFLTAFSAAAIASAILAGHALVTWSLPAAPWLLAGALLYLLGVVLLTMVCNVPLNKHLDRVDAASAEGERLWTRYLSEWTMWNHLRTIASIASAACFVMALIAGT
jgi:uncharacterized membrane protein